MLFRALEAVRTSSIPVAAATAEKAGPNVRSLSPIRCVGCWLKEVASRSCPRDPGIGRVAGDADMHDRARGPFPHEEGMDGTEEQVGNRQEVAGPDALCMVVQEGGPALTRAARRADAAQVLLDGRFGDPDLQVEQLTTNAFSAPGTVGCGHLPDERDGLGRDGRPMCQRGGT
jgi:hypothetical protein